MALVRIMVVCLPLAVFLVSAKCDTDFIPMDSAESEAIRAVDHEEFCSDIHPQTFVNIQQVNIYVKRIMKWSLWID